MAVYTALEKHELTDLCANYDLGKLESFQGVDAGIENTTYFLSLTSGEYVLTIFEYLEASALPFFIELTTKLNNADLPVPCPIPNNENQCISFVRKKPALIFPKAPGAHTQTPQASECFQIGHFCGQMHSLAPRDPQLTLGNSRGMDWMKSTFASIKPYINHRETQLFTDIIEQYSAKLHAISELPSGVVHCDLFHDNALFHEGQLSAVIDFYFSCSENFMIDLAIVANDWCWSETDHQMNPLLLEALIKGYRSARAMSKDEQAFFPVACKIAIMRFWLSRREDEIRLSGRKLKPAKELQQKLEHLIEFPSVISQYC